MLHKILPLFLAFMCLTNMAVAQQTYTVESPDGRIAVTVQAADRLEYSVERDGTVLLQNSTLAMTIGDQVLGEAPQVADQQERTVDEVVEPVVQLKAAQLRDHYNELRLDMESDYAVVFRAYDEGVAYRFETSLSDEEVTVYDEEAHFNFAGDVHVYYPSEEGFFSHNERAFTYYPMQDLTADSLASVPAVVDAGGVKIAIADADIRSYPGLWFRGAGANGLAATFPPYPLDEELSGDRNFRVTQAADYIAVTEGTRTFPWRVLAIAEQDGDLITNSLIYLLAEPSQIEDSSWIQPGKVAWDWYNANNIYGVDFEAGVNTQTYKYYIDFASQYGLEYVILDEGWYTLGDVLAVVPDIDVEELVAYGEEKNVGIVLWVVAKTLEDQLIPALDQYEAWGIKGIKVDFMQRDDQKLIDYYHRVSHEAAERQMLVNFHGAIRPATMTRTWPNLISTEGVRGLENNKWGFVANPEHNVTIPFTRMFLGPMDYTPGAMLNASRPNFRPIFQRPMSMGTRVHQLAMYVVYESPMQMLADSPSNYLREPEVMDFLGPVPATWDETRVLGGAIGDYVIVARRHGEAWYIGAMTDWTERDLEIDLSFLPEGTFQMEAYQDGVNADRYGGDYKQVTQSVDQTTRLQVHLAPGGGWAARLVP